MTLDRPREGAVKILLVEDEDKLARLLTRGLTEDGHVVDHVADGERAREQGQAIAYDVIVLDWMLPGRDGLSVLRAWRDAGLKTPVLMLTARDTTEERVLALRTGADDHLGKPFAYDELLARLEALYRRAGPARTSRALGDVVLDEKKRALRGPAREETLTPREWALFDRLATHTGDVVTRSELLSTVWGQDFDGTPNVVDVYVGYLRTKLEGVESRRVHIVAVRGVGFRLQVDAGPGA